MDPERCLCLLRLRLRSLFRRRRLEQELDEELQYHLERRIEEGLANGLTPAEARTAALRSMEGLERCKEECRDARGVSWIEDLGRDLRYAVRMLRKDAGFTAAALACLALGIGANTAIFSLMDAVLLKSLPVKNPERLVVLSWTSKKGLPRELRSGSSGYGNMSLPPSTLHALQERSRTLSDAIGFAPLGFNNQALGLRIAGATLPAGGEMVTGNYFSGLGVTPILGRPLTEADSKPGAPHVAVISYSLWSRRFGRDRSAVGSSMAIDGVPFTVVGVAPPEFFGVNPGLVPDLWVPMREESFLTPWGIEASTGQSMFSGRWWWLLIVGRLKPGVSALQARAELDPLFQQSITAGLNPAPKPADMPHIELTPAGENLNFLRMRFSQPLRILMAAVALVLLITCANVATLLLARAAARQKEMSIRLSTGAGRARLVRQLLTESVLLAGAGGLLGLLFAQWSGRALVLLLAGARDNFPLAVRPDGAVLLFTAAVSLLTGVLFGLAPALRATRVDLAVSLKESTRTASARLGLGNVLIAGQVAFSLLLLVGAGLFVRTLQKLDNQNLGFNRRNVLVFALDPRQDRGSAAPLSAFYQRMLEGLQALPGVQSATSSQLALMTGWVNGSDIVADGPPVQPGEAGMLWNGVGPRFLETLGIPLVLGRPNGWPDVSGNRPVAVVSEALARHFFPGRNPLGRHFRFLGSGEDFEIIGVAADARYDGLRGEPPRTAYLPYTSVGPLGRMCFELRTAGDPAALIPAVRAVIRRMDPDLPLLDVKTLSDQIDESLRQERMFARLSSFFGALALLLVAVGMSGTLAYSVTRRTNEIGLRMALGAPRGRVLWMVLRQSRVLVACGVVLGVPLALAATRLVESRLYGVKANDPASLGAAVLILAAAAALAGYVPARRASRVDPTVALRYE